MLSLRPSAGSTSRPATGAAKAFYALIALSTCLGMLINFTGITRKRSVLTGDHGFLAPWLSTDDFEQFG